MIIDIEELESAVYNINYDIVKSSNFKCFLMSVQTTGKTQYVIFIGMELWNSDDDMRKFTDDGEFELIENYLRRAVNEELEKLKEIKISEEMGDG